MYFRRFYDEQLAQASYLIGCQATGEAIVIDPSRVVDSYLECAAAEQLRITAVTETHIHADFVSGSRQLAAATGARMYLSGCGPAEWQYGFRNQPNVTVLNNHDTIEVGNVLIEAVHTPSHTPEHLVFLVTDRAGASEPMGIVTGDFVFVGDVGRPDLLEKAAHVADTAVGGAKDLFRSLTWFKSLPDHLQVWPGHGAGSACGKGLGAVPQSTVGYERRFNWGLGDMSEAEFVRQVLLGQPDPPKYFGRMKRINRDGPPVLAELPRPNRMEDRQLAGLVERRAVVVDTRPTVEFAGAHVPGTINIPLNRNFPTYAGSLLPYDQDLYFILGDDHADTIERLVRNLVSIGFDRVSGYVRLSALEAWTDAGKALGSVAQTTVADLAQRMGDGVFILDVRNRSEWDGGHLEDATLIPLPELVDRLGEIPTGRDIVVHCQGGGRSAIAASVLKSAGRDRVSNLVGGFGAWIASGKGRVGG